MAALQEAQHFLSPVLDQTQLLSHRNLSLLERLTHTLPTLPTTSTSTSTSPARPVLTHALHLLKAITTSPATPTTSLVNATDARTLNALLDLLVLEGIYPSLSPGVGVPLSRRARNFVIPASRQRVVEIEDQRDPDLLGEVVGGLIDALGAEATTKTVRERCLVDVLAGCGELAFLKGGSEGWKERWWAVVDSTPTPSLLPSLLSLLHPTIPSPFRAPLTRALSTLPTSRPHAVRHILELFLSTVSDAALSLDALSNASRIIGAVPAATKPEEYFGKVCPQLIELLDGKDAGLARAAAYVLAELLGRKGPVEAVVEREVVGVVVAGMVPEPKPEPEAVKSIEVIEKPTRATSSALLAFEDAPQPQKPKPSFSLIQEISDEPMPAADTTYKPLIPEATLSQTLTRLSLLLTAHPSPSVPQRLLAPLLVPLWALTIYAQTTSRSTWHTRAISLLRTHIKTSPSAPTVLAELHKHLLAADTGHGSFGPGELGGIEVRAGSAEVGISEIDVRVEAFIELLGEAPEEALAEFFLGLLRAWLGRETEEDSGREGAMRMLATMKVLREIMSRHEGALAKSPTQTLQIVGGVLDEYRLWKEVESSRNIGEALTPSLGGLGRIVNNAPLLLKREKEEDDSDDGDLDEESSRAQTVTLALSLLSVLVSSPDTKLTPTDERLLQTLHPALTFLTTAPAVPVDLSSFSTNILSLLNLHTPTTATTSISPHQQQKESHALALSYLRDPLIPVRAHGLHLLRTLILESSPTIDIPSTASLLISTLSDGDSYIYLNAVKALTALADKHSKTVTRTLVESYVDPDEKRSLDERLRIGEALLGIVQRLGATLVGESASVLAEGVIAVVSRRKTRSSKPSGDEFGDDGEEDDEVVGEEEAEKKKRLAEYNASIVRGWAAGRRTEDVRVRTSALSILGAAIETNAAGLGARILNDAVDISLLVLTLETGPAFGILRRAAVVAIGGVLRALVGGEEGEEGGGEWKEAVWKVLRGRVGEVRRVLGYVRVTDGDGLVREQAGVVMGELEEVLGMWVGGAGAGGSGGGRIVEVGGGEGGLRVL